MNSFRVLYSKDAKKFIKSNKYVGLQIMQAFDAITKDFRSSFGRYDIKSLKSHENMFRLRIGKYRAIFQILDDTLILYVISAGSRGDIYKKTL